MNAFLIAVFISRSTVPHAQLRIQWQNRQLVSVPLIFFSLSIFLLPLVEYCFNCGFMYVCENDTGCKQCLKDCVVHLSFLLNFSHSA